MNMKKIILNILLSALFLSFPVLLISQQTGFGNNSSNKSKCLSDEARIEIQNKIQENRKKLNLTVNSSLKSDMVDSLIFPLVVADSILGYAYFNGISNYVDQDMTAGIQDYNCLDNTYNGHQGTDFFTFPFPWYLYENDLVHVISASSGTIVYKQDGNFDRNCSIVAAEEWNGIYVQHADGSTVWYGHFKSGSLTSKAIGDYVEKGEYLGVVGSSGASSDAHLHLEYYDKDDNLLDPYQGECNTLNSNSLWEKQLPHNNQRINAVLTHSTLPQLQCGPENEIAEFSNEFFLNDTIAVAVYITDYIKETIIETNIYAPDNSLVDNFTSFNNDNSFEWFWNYRGYIFTEDLLPGTWTIESKLNDQIVTHSFEYFGVPTNIVEQANNNIIVYPNPVTDNIFLQTSKSIKGSEYSIINFLGETIQSGKLFENKIPVNNLDSGIYYLILLNERLELLPKKIIKI